jgi:DNA-binding CsgD family transcriptional regulator
MGRSESVRTHDVRQIMRLIHDSLELGSDALAWRQHFLKGMRRIIGEHVRIMTTILPLPVDPTNANAQFCVMEGWTPEAQAFMLKYFDQGDLRSDPVTPGILSLGSRSFTRVRGQLCSDATWYNSSYFNEIRRKIDDDDIVYSQRSFHGLKCNSGIGLTREIHGKPFSRREQLLVHIAHSELYHLWRRDQYNQLHLSNRQRQVLESVCKGFSEKEVAVQLSISRHTVHNYVSTLHQKLKVQTRAELVVTGLKMLRRSGPKLLPD